MPLPKPKLLAGWRRAKLIALINELYLSFRGCGTCGVVVNALALSTNPQAGPLRYSLAFHLRRSKKPNCEPKLRPPAVSKSLTRSTQLKLHVVSFQPRNRLLTRGMAMDADTEATSASIPDRLVRFPNTDGSRVPLDVYRSQEIYDREQERIFRGPTWSFLALEAEIPN